MWPSLCARRSFVGIASARNGKTLGYLVPVLNSLLTTARGDPCYPPGGDDVTPGDPPGEAPLAVVVAPTWKKAVGVSEVLGEFVKGVEGAFVPNDGVRIKAVLVFEREEEMRAVIMNGKWRRNTKYWLLLALHCLYFFFACCFVRLVTPYLLPHTSCLNVFPCFMLLSS